MPNLEEFSLRSYPWCTRYSSLPESEQCIFDADELHIDGALKNLKAIDLSWHHGMCEPCRLAIHSMLRNHIPRCNTIKLSLPAEPLTLFKSRGEFEMENPLLNAESHKKNLWLDFESALPKIGGTFLENLVPVTTQLIIETREASSVSTKILPARDVKRI